MTWGAQVELLLQRAGFWLIHVNRVAFWVLAAVASLLLLLRLLGLRLFRGTLRDHARAYPSSRRLELYAFAAFLALGGTGFQALRPDAYFYSALGRAALTEGDFPAAILYYEPLAAWGSKDSEVYLALGVSYLRLGHERLAANAFDRALQYAPSEVRTHLLRAYVARRLGENEQAVQHLRRAYELETEASSRAAILAELHALDPQGETLR